MLLCECVLILAFREIILFSFYGSRVEALIQLKESSFALAFALALVSWKFVIKRIRIRMRNRFVAGKFSNRPAKYGNVLHVWFIKGLYAFQWHNSPFYVEINFFNRLLLDDFFFIIWIWTEIRRRLTSSLFTGIDWFSRNLLLGWVFIKDLLKSDSVTVFFPWIIIKRWLNFMRSVVYWYGSFFSPGVMNWRFVCRGWDFIIYYYSNSLIYSYVEQFIGALLNDTMKSINSLPIIKYLNFTIDK